MNAGRDEAAKPVVAEVRQTRALAGERRSLENAEREEP